MFEIILETLIDSVKMLPFLFISYLIIEVIEHKSANKLKAILSKSGKFGPAVGSTLGLLPQCGFSITASNLYSSRVITLGTLIAVFLATSDEAIPVLLSHPNNLGALTKILVIKFIFAFLMGFIIDFCIRKFGSKHSDVDEAKDHIHDMCAHCHCSSKNVLLSSAKHTVTVFIFILIVSFILNTTIHLIGEENLSRILMSGSIFQPFVAGIIGLIPNCASSVLLTELYLAGNITFGSIMAGLLTGSGMGIVILFKSNKNLKENLKILSIIFAIGTLFGFLIEVIGMVF